MAIHITRADRSELNRHPWARTIMRAAPMLRGDVTIKFLGRPHNEMPFNKRILHKKNGLSVGAGLMGLGAELDYAISPETGLGGIQRITLKKKF